MAKIILCIILLTLAFQSPLLAACQQAKDAYAIVDDVIDEISFDDSNGHDPADDYTIPVMVDAGLTPLVKTIDAAYFSESIAVFPEQHYKVHTPPPRLR